MGWWKPTPPLTPPRGNREGKEAQPSPSPLAERGEEDPASSQGGQEALWVGAHMAGIENEWQIGVLWRRYPNVEQIADKLPISVQDAIWLRRHCLVKGKRVESLIRLNDAARAIALGTTMDEVKRWAKLVYEQPAVRRPGV